MKPPFPSPVATWHNDTYAAISPTREEISCHGKTVIVTGAGGTIGREVAATFAAAGARHVALIGRKLDPLNRTKETVMTSGQATCSVHAADVTDIAVMTAVASEIGTWDIFVLNAGYIPAPASIASADVDDCWQAYETNVKSVLITAKAFLPTANQTRAVLLGTISGALVFPTSVTVGASAYLVSKMALAKTLEYLASENPHLFVVSVHPGMVDTPVFRKGGYSPNECPMDSAKLPAHFMLWLASPEASNLNGRIVWANWDVEELKIAAAKIKDTDQLTVTMQGWPFSM